MSEDIARAEGGNMVGFAAAGLLIPYLRAHTWSKSAVPPNWTGGIFSLIYSGEKIPDSCKDRVALNQKYLIQHKTC